MQTDTGGHCDVVGVDSSDILESPEVLRRSNRLCRSVRFVVFYVGNVSTIGVAHNSYGHGKEVP